jgi:hypothetical protein
MELSRQLHAPTTFPQERTRYPLNKRLCGPLSWSGCLVTVVNQYCLFCFILFILACVALLEVHLKISWHIQRLKDKNSYDKQKQALFNLTWLTFESQSPTDNLWTPGFLWYVVHCEGTQNLWYLDYFIYLTPVLQMYLFSFVWMKWSHCSFPAVNAGRDLWSNVMIWIVFILTKTSRKSITLLLIIICLKLLNQEYILQLLPNCENFGVFPDLYVQKYPTIFHMWVGFLTVLH